MSDTISALSLRALDDLATVVRALPADAADALIDGIAKAKRIAVYGAGREGLQMRGFAMRLFHLGLDVHVVADMTVPPLGKGDLLIITAGPGANNIGDALMKVAREAGAKTAIVTAQPEGRSSKAADILFTIPAQTMANDRGAAVSVLPMGSLFETAQMLVFEILILKLRERLGETAETMRARHTNME